uniref:DUF4614 domain-containing protein n=1 Tax=Macrostomum lignano TaxID=282301 RepID=A0A1I8F4K0_9PLAT
ASQAPSGGSHQPDELCAAASPAAICGQKAPAPRPGLHHGRAQSRQSGTERRRSLLRVCSSFRTDSSSSMDAALVPFCTTDLRLAMSTVPPVSGRLSENFNAALSERNVDKAQRLRSGARQLRLFSLARLRLNPRRRDLLRQAKDCRQVAPSATSRVRRGLPDVAVGAAPPDYEVAGGAAGRRGGKRQLKLHAKFLIFRATIETPGGSEETRLYDRRRRDSSSSDSDDEENKADEPSEAADSITERERERNFRELMNLDAGLADPRAGAAGLRVPDLPLRRLRELPEGPRAQLRPRCPSSPCEPCQQTVTEAELKSCSPMSSWPGCSGWGSARPRPVITKRLPLRDAKLRRHSLNWWTMLTSFECEAPPTRTSPASNTRTTCGRRAENDENAKLGLQETGGHACMSGEPERPQCPRCFLSKREAATGLMLLRDAGTEICWATRGRALGTGRPG